MAEPIVRLREVLLGYDRPLLPPVSLEVSVGDFLGIVGPNGSGKTTLLRTMCGILRPLGGRLEYPGGRPRIGYVPQRGRLDDVFPLSAREVVALNLVPTLGPLGWLRRKHWRAADAHLDQLGVADLAKTPFRHLSGGQKQRVLLARALVIEPELLVLDEPTSALDPDAEHRILSQLEQLRSERRMGFVFVSHDLPLTAHVADRLAIVDKERQTFRIGSREEIMKRDALEAIYGPEGVRHVLHHADETARISSAEAADG